MKRILGILVLIWTLAGAKEPFTIADFYRIKSVGDPHFSPDGKQIVFSVTEANLEQGRSNADIYLINADGTGLRRLTYAPQGDFSPQWSTDGKNIAFVATRNNGPQIWLMPSDLGEPIQWTNFSAGISNPILLPDGKNAVFVSEIFPECGADNDCNIKLDSGIREGMVQAHLADRLFFRHWSSWKEGKRFHIVHYDSESKTFQDLTPGDWDAPAMMSGMVSAGFALSPDGKEICVAANADSNEYETTNKDLWLIPISEPCNRRNLTFTNNAFDGSPAYSPDGRFIAYISQKVPDYEADLFRLSLYDRATAQTSVLSENFDFWVSHPVWSHDSKNIYFLAEVRGRKPLYRYELDSKRIVQVLDLKTIDAFDLSPDGKNIVVARRSVGEPTELWLASVISGAARRLTFFNQVIEETVDIRPAEELWITSPTGKRIHTFIVKPHDFDPKKKYPLILNVHGGPQSQWADAFRGDWQVYPGAGYVVAFPNPYGSTGYGQDFTLGISKDWGGKVYQDVMAVADSLARIPWIDGDRMGAMGWSYGGYMMMWLEGHTDRFKALAAMMGIYNLTSFYGTTEELWFPEYDLGGTPWDSELYEKWSPHRFTENFMTPCLVITGEKDFRVSYTQSLEFFTALQKRGVPSRLIVFKNDGHWPNGVKSMPLYYAAHLDWFHKYLGGEPAPYNILKMVRNQIFMEKN